MIRVRFGERLPSSMLQYLAMEKWTRQGITYLQVCTRDKETVKYHGFVVGIIEECR